MFNIFYIILSLFIYAYLFGNIASMVSEFINVQFLDMNEKYQTVMKKINKEKIPFPILKNIKAYYNLLWNKSKGISNQFIENLPSSLKQDVLLERFKDCFYNNPIFLFKNEMKQD